MSLQTDWEQQTFQSHQVKCKKQENKQLFQPRADFLESELVASQ